MPAEGTAAPNRLNSIGTGIPHSLYVHVPFCRHRCAYCDFNTYAGKESAIPSYVAALCQEIADVGALFDGGLPVHTVYFGGGTPSLLKPNQVRDILAAIRAAFRVRPDAEVTLEANPGTVDRSKLTALRDLGINRLSFGIQSANAEELQQLERTHGFLDVLHAFSAARAAGFDNLSGDLIYGLPGQALQTWQATVKRILDLGPEHISAYALTLEHGTPFGAWVARGLLPSPDPDLAADMYEWLCQELGRAAFAQYEISNWARPGFQSRHNKQYWKGLPYLGVGAGAHGYSKGYRYSNVLAVQAYIERLQDPPARAGNRQGAGQNEVVPTGQDQAVAPIPMSRAGIECRHQTPADEMADFMIMGLRLTREGIAEGAFRHRFGRSLAQQYGAEIDELRSLGLLEVYAGEVCDAGETAACPTNAYVIRLTPKGRLLGNQVFRRFVN